MKRWFYILLGGLGIALGGSAVFMLWLSPSLPPPYPLPLMITECICIVLGFILGGIGIIKGRDAGEYDVSQYLKSGKNRRDHHVAGTEIDFSCPACHKIYHASPLLAGNPFTCRDCQNIFNVPNRAPAASPAVG